MKAQQTRGGNSGTSRAASVEQSASAPTKAARSNSDAQERLRSRSSGLQNGSEGRDVKSLQDELQWGGYLSGEDKNTGWGTFGPKTEAAVRALQAAEGLEVTGVVDAATRKALRASVAAHNSEAGLPAPLAEGDEGGSVRRVQKALVKLGFLSQAAYERHPGSYSGQTARGVKRLQADAGLTESGSLDAETWQALIDRAGREVTGQDPEKGRVVTGDPQMKEGSEGASVKELERLLEDYGAELSPDRVYDKDTTKAVKAFQKANNLVSDGRVGVATAAALVSGRATSVGAGSWNLDMDIDSLTYADAVELARSAGSPLFKRADFTVLALRTGHEAIPAFEDHFVVLHKSGDMRVFAGSTRPDFYTPSSAWNPTMLLPGNYMLRPREWTGLSMSQPVHQDAYVLYNQDGSAAVPTAQNRPHNGSYDNVYDEEERNATPFMDDEIRLHRGTNGKPGSAGCLTVEDYDAFVEYLGGCDTEFDLCLIDITELGKNAQS